jgi:hypothetical protein
VDHAGIAEGRVDDAGREALGRGALDVEAAADDGTLDCAPPGAAVSIGVGSPAPEGVTESSPVIPPWWGLALGTDREPSPIGEDPSVQRSRMASAPGRGGRGVSAACVAR